MANGDGTKTPSRVLARLRALPKDHPTRVKSRARTKKWLAEHPESRSRYWVRRKLKYKQAFLADPAAARYKSRKRFLRKYGLSPEQWDVRFAQQGSRCAICGSPKSGDGRWHTDHDHAQGLTAVRGILCVQCNTGLGAFRDDPKNLQKAIAYLQAWNHV